MYLCLYILICIIPCITVSEAVTDLTVTPNKRSALLEATPPPVTNGIIVSYNVSYNVNGSMDIRMMVFTATVNQELRGTVEPLLPFTIYVFKVSACTSVGCGPFSVNVTETTLEDGELAYKMHFVSMQFVDKRKYLFCKTYPSYTILAAHTQLFNSVVIQASQLLSLGLINS